jgi:hypothetical protein
MFSPREGVIVPLYAARLADLRLGDYVQAECVCGNVSQVIPELMLWLGAKPTDRVLYLAPRLHRREFRDQKRSLGIGGMPGLQR